MPAGAACGLPTCSRLPASRTARKHVWFEGLDPIKEKDGSVAPFGGSIPLDKALAKDQPALLADAMNDQPLTAEHGFPLRTIVPGYIGARSVKWLTKIVVSDRPSPNHYLAEAYKLIQTDAKDEVAAAEPIYTFPVNAAICTPAAGPKLKSGRTTVAGYALPSGEPGCTVDQGRTIEGRRPHLDRVQAARRQPALFMAALVRRDRSSRRQARAYRLRYRLPGAHDARKARLELKGYICNSWHRVVIEVA